jgi:hypothetical protein
MDKTSHTKRTRDKHKKTKRSPDKAAKDNLKPPPMPTIIKEGYIEPGGERMREEILEHHASGTRLTGGDLDADWESADDVGDEAVGGHAPTPDQDEVDAIGRALGVEQDEDAEVRTHEEIFSKRDRDRWELDRRSVDQQPTGKPAKRGRRQKAG